MGKVLFLVGLLGGVFYWPLFVVAAFGIVISLCDDMIAMYDEEAAMYDDEEYPTD